MAVGDTKIQSSIVAPTGESISIINRVVYEDSYPILRGWREYEDDGTFIEYSEEYTVNRTAEDAILVVDGQEIPLVSGNMDYMDGLDRHFSYSFTAGGAFQYGVDDQDALAYINSPQFSGDTIFFWTHTKAVAVTPYIDWSTDDFVDQYRLFEEFEEYSVAWDSELGILGDDEWRPVIGDGFTRGNPSSAYLYVARGVDGDDARVELWNTLTTDSTDPEHYTISDVTDIEMKNLDDGSYLAGTAFDVIAQDGYEPSLWRNTEIRVDLVDADGNIQTKSDLIAIAEGEELSLSSRIIDIDGDGAVYITSYIPAYPDVSYENDIDGYRTNVYIASDDGIRRLTIYESDIHADNITGIQFLDNEQIADISFTGADGVSHIGRYYAEWHGTNGVLSADNPEISNHPTSQDDILIYGDAPDKISAYAGNDYIDGGAGADIIRGGEGADTFAVGAGTGADRIQDFSLDEGDLLDASQLVDAGMHVAAISTRYNGKQQEIGVNVTDLDSGKVLADLRGDMTAASTANGGFTGTHDETGHRVFWAAAELDNTGAEKFSGTVGADLITVLAGQKVYAGAGDDVIVFEHGGMAEGGTGEDLFIFGDTGGRIRDFDAGVDVIDLSDWGVQSLDDLTMAVRLTGKGAATDDLLISDGDHVIRLDGTLASELGADDFLFA